MEIFIGIVIVLAPSFLIFFGAYVSFVIRMRRQRRQSMTPYQRLQRVVS